MPDKSIYVTQPQLPPLGDLIPYLEDIWDTKILTNAGPIHEQLEQALCDYLGVEHVALCANGSIALMVALEALGVKGEVITTPYTFVATTNAIQWCGNTPVFVDINPRTFNLDPNKIEAAINEHTAAIMPVHCYGAPCDVEEIQEIASRHGLPVIYDAAHAFAAQDNGGSILRHGDMSILSFHATKIFNTFEGGAIICNDSKMLERINRIKNHGFSDEMTVNQIGINGKLSEVAAAFGLALLPHIDSSIASRKNSDAVYRKSLKPISGIKCIPLVDTIIHNYSYFPVLVENDYPLTRDELYEVLRGAGIYARRYFYPLTSEFPMYKTLPSAAALNLPIATKLSQQIICLPLFPDMTNEQLSRITTIIIDNGLRNS